MSEMRIEIADVVRQRLPRYSRFIPRFVVKWLERLIHQDEINALLAMRGDKENVEAAALVLQYLNITTEVIGEENLPTDGRHIFVCNHPLGGLDGLSLITLLGTRYKGAIRFLVNDLLMAVKPMQGIFLPVNKYGRQSRDAAAEIEAQYQGNNQMITFPAGLCSRINKQGEVRDLEWRKFVVTQAVRTRRNVVPMYFHGANSKRFYRLAKWRKRLGIKFNIEMILLPDEMFRVRNHTFQVVVGEPIPWQSFDVKHPKAEAARLKQLCYDLQRATTQ